MNRAGTYTVALLAQLANRPVYVFAESYKFARKTYLSHKDIPYAIHHDSKGKCVSVDLTPSKYISMFCMENGLFTPEVVSYELARIFA